MAHEPCWAWWWWIAVAVAGLAYNAGKKNTPAGPRGDRCRGVSTTKPAGHVALLKVAATSPAAGATNVPVSNADHHRHLVLGAGLLGLHSAMPTLAPPVPGTRAQPSARTLEYDLTAPLIPSSNEVLTVPGGQTGLRGTNGGARRPPAIGQLHRGRRQYPAAAGDPGHAQLHAAGVHPDRAGPGGPGPGPSRSRGPSPSAGRASTPS